MYMLLIFSLKYCSMCIADVQESGIGLVRDVFLGEILHTGQVRPKLRAANTVCAPGVLRA
jgi:hypothetical protein